MATNYSIDEFKQEKKKYEEETQSLINEKNDYKKKLDEAQNDKDKEELWKCIHDIDDQLKQANGRLLEVQKQITNITNIDCSIDCSTDWQAVDSSAADRVHHFAYAGAINTARYLLEHLCRDIEKIHTEQKLPCLDSCKSTTSKLKHFRECKDEVVKGLYEELYPKVQDLKSSRDRRFLPAPPSDLYHSLSDFIHNEIQQWLGQEFRLFLPSNSGDENELASLNIFDSDIDLLTRIGEKFKFKIEPIECRRDLYIQQNRQRFRGNNIKRRKTR